MNKAAITIRITASVAVLVALSASMAGADAIMTTVVPSQIQAGQTYTLYVEANNTGLGGAKTIGIEWDLIKPLYIEVLTAALPVSNDFFEGFDMLSGFNRVNMPEHLSGRSADVLGHGMNYGPVSKVGDIGVYTFRIDPNYTGQFPSSDNFGLSDVAFYSTSGDADQPYGVVNEQFTIQGIPEPTTLGLLGLGSLLVLLRKRR